MLNVLNVTYINENKVSNYIKMFLEDARHNSENTYTRYRKAVEVFFDWHTNGKGLDFISEGDIRKINYGRMKEFRNHLVNERKNANSTVNGTMSVLYSLFQELQKIDNNFLGININNLRLSRLNESDSESYGDIGWEEADRMIEYVKSMPPRKLPKVKAALIHTARMTGIRLSGLLNLKYKDLRKEDGLWVLYHSLKGKRHMQGIKESDAEMLLELRKDSTDDNEKIFKISSKTVDRMIAEIIEALG